MVRVVISYHYLTSTTLKRGWEGAWGSTTLKPLQPRKKPRCDRRTNDVLFCVGDDRRQRCHSSRLLLDHLGGTMQVRSPPDLRDANGTQLAPKRAEIT